MAQLSEARDRLRVIQGWSGPSPKAYEGWTPTFETTYEWELNAFGKPVRLIRSITRQIEPEWGAADRALAEALAAYDGDVCPGCGVHRSMLDDPDNHTFTIEHDTCEVCALIDRETRRTAARDAEFDRLHPQPDPKSPLLMQLRAAGVKQPSDGRQTRLRLLTPDEVAAIRARAQKPKEA